jgi:hypothetical protein
LPTTPRSLGDVDRVTARPPGTSAAVGSGHRGDTLLPDPAPEWPERVEVGGVQRALPDYSIDDALVPGAASYDGPHEIEV